MKIEITNQPNGVSAVLRGFRSDEIERKIQECKEGQCGCDCDPAIMDKITDIKLTTLDGEMKLNITGDVDADQLEPMMKECLIGEKQ
jgi:hypothetical protein